MEMAISKVGMIMTAVLLVMPAVPGVDGQEFHAYVGQDAVLQCRANYVWRYPGWTFVYQFLNVHVQHEIDIFSIGGLSIHPEYVDRVSYAANRVSLVLEKITLADAGLYECRSDRHERITTLHVWNTPVISNQLADGTVTGTEGQTLTLTCTCTGGKEAPSMKWYRDTTQSTALASWHPRTPEAGVHTISITYTFTPAREDDGSVYICQLSASLEYLDNVLYNVSAQLRLNSITTPGPTTTPLTPEDPPDVIATVTTTDQYIELTCSPSGVTSTYLYSSWEHTWPGYGEITRPLLAAAPTLRLYNLTYADSGIYTCRVSNGVAPYGTSDVIRTGSTEAITIKSRPKIVNPSTTGTDILKFVVKLNQPTSVNVTYYSTSDPTLVSFYFVIGTVRQSPSIGTVKTDTTQIDLPVFNSVVPTLGTRATVTWSIPDEFGLGFYEVVLRNDVGEASVVMEAVIEGPPTRPANLQTTNRLSTSVDVSWQLGFHGGYPQTCVLEYSTNEVTWTEGATLDTGLSTSRTGHHVTVDSLRPGTNYYLRMYAYNQLGSSPHTYTLNVTTSGVQYGYSGAGGDSMSLFAAGAVGAGAVLFICAVGFIVLYKKGYIGRNGKQGAKYSEETNMNETVIGGAPRQIRGVPDESDASALPNRDEAPTAYDEIKPSASLEDDTETYTELELYETTDRQKEVYENMKI